MLDDKSSQKIRDTTIWDIALLSIGSIDEVNDLKVEKAQEHKKFLLDDKSSQKIRETTIWDIALINTGS